MIRELRKALSVPATANAETYACVNALVGSHVGQNEVSAENTASGDFMAKLRTQGARMEASGIMKYAATMKSQVFMQDGVRSALATCH